MMVISQFIDWRETVNRKNAEIGVTAAAALLSPVATIAKAPTALTAALGILLFCSLGYVWIKVFFASDLKNVERLGAATGLALAVPVLGGLALQAAKIPLTRVTWVILIAGPTLVGDIVLVGRGMPGHAVESRSPKRAMRPGWHRIMFGAAIVIALGAVAFSSVSAESQHYPPYTQLWLYTHGNVDSASLGLTNGQGTTKHYRLVLLRNGHASEAWSLVLSNGQTWQRSVSVSGNSATVAELYLLPDVTHPYRRVSTASNRTS